MSPENRSASLKCVGDDAFEARGSGRSREERLINNKGDIRRERTTRDFRLASGR